MLSYLSLPDDCKERVVLRSCLVLVDQSCRRWTPRYQTIDIFATRLQYHRQSQHSSDTMDSSSKIFWISLRMIQLAITILILGLSAYGTPFLGSIINNPLTSHSQQVLPRIRVHPIRIETSQLPPPQLPHHALRANLHPRHPRPLS